MESMSFLASISICKIKHQIQSISSSNEINFKILSKLWIFKSFSLVFEIWCQKVAFWNHLNQRFCLNNLYWEICWPHGKRQHLKLLCEHLRLRVHIVMNLNLLQELKTQRWVTHRYLWNLVICSLQTTSIAFVLKDFKWWTFFHLDQ
jgi:hypothetical protein